jgi:SAM-dependent methyltransferase
MTTEISSEISQESIPFGVELRCPLCARNVSSFSCGACKFEMVKEGGVIRALPPDRQIHFSQFVADYEYIRKEEGRNSRDEAFYLSLPYLDTTGHNSGQWKIRAKTFDYLVRRILRPLPREARVLDLGAGNCWASYRLSLEGYKPIAVDLLTNEDDGLGAAKHFREVQPNCFPCFQAELHCLPFQDGQFDAAVFNASFHYSENYEEALKEALRCLKPGGLLVICDTPWYSSEASGDRMIVEKRASFKRQFNTASDSVRCLEFLTDERLRKLGKNLEIVWSVHRPWYGFRWHSRPFSAWLRRKREPSRFRIYVAKRIFSV